VNLKTYRVTRNNPVKKAQNQVNY